MAWQGFQQVQEVLLADAFDRVPVPLSGQLGAFPADIGQVGVELGQLLVDPGAEYVPAVGFPALVDYVAAEVVQVGCFPFADDFGFVPYYLADQVP